MRLAVAAFAAALAIGAGGGATAAQGQQTEDIRRFLIQLQRVVQGGDQAAFEALLADSADRARVTAFIGAEVRAGMTRAVIQERDRGPLAGTLPGNGYSLLVDAFQEFGPRARSAAWRLDLKRTGEPGTDTEWQIADAQRLSSVENLYRLSLDSTKQFTARNLKISDEDLDLVMTDGSVFVSDTDQGTTAVVLVGRGTVTFRPAPETEKGQVKIFCGAETLETSFGLAYLRINPVDFDRLVSSRQLVARPVDPREFRRADKVFREDSPKSYSLDLGDLSTETWSLVPGAGDFVAELHTQRFDTITYTRSTADAEDVSLFDRKRRKTIALYPSKEKARSTSASAGDSGAPYEVLHYDVDLSAAPERRWIDARVRMKLRIRANAVSSLTMRLANPLVVQSITSDEYGRLFSMRVRGQNSLVVNLPATLLQGTEFSVTITYAGRLEPQALDSETIALQQLGGSITAEGVGITLEPSVLYSNGSNWYPESPLGGFKTATLRIMVPAGLACVATGELEIGSPELVPGKDASLARMLYVFNARQPLRYLAFIVSRLATAQNVTVGFSPQVADAARRSIGASYRSLNVSVEANPRHTGRGREVGERAVDIALFYQSLVDDSPFPSFTVALVESDLPGGHSPGYFAALNQTLPTSPYVWRNDPASFDNYPDFFLAHEMAHQWWGQAVGWRGYHEQWISEGFAQYFAALYARRESGDGVFADVMRQMRKWAMNESDKGPISLGYRLGHIRNESKVFRALVYNKSAVVLHMLRQLVGDDEFFSGLQRFYRTSRFRNVGTVDFKQAMETETGRSLDRFFERWIYGAALPQLKFSYLVDGADVVLHVEQIGEVFDLPVAVTLHYADKRTTNVLVHVTDRVVDLRVPLEGTLRTVAISKDESPLARIVKN